MKNHLFLLIIVISTLKSYSQQNRWKEYLQKRNYNDISTYQNKVILNTNNIITEYSSEEINQYWKNNLLNNVNISSLDTDANNIYIGYNNGAIDIINNNISYLINDIKNSNISNDKIINHINNVNDTLYISTNFGIVSYNVEKKETIDTYIIGNNSKKIKIYKTLFKDEFLYAATSEGLKKIDKNKNFKNLENWIVIDNNITKEIITYNNKIHYIIDSLTNNYVKYIDNENKYSINIYSKNLNRLNNIDNNLYIVSENKIYKRDIIETIDSIVKYYDWTNIIYPSGITKLNDKLYVSDHRYGLIEINKQNNINIKFNSGPWVDNTFKVNYLNNQLWLTHSNSMDFNYNRDGASNFNKENWRIYNSSTYYFQLDTIFDAMNVVINPDENKSYIAYYTNGGITEVKNDKFKIIYSNYNSELKPTYWGAQSSISSIKYDQEGNLYSISNQATDKPIAVLATDSIWYELPFTNEVKNNFFGEMIHTSTNDTWVTKPKGNGLLVFRDNKTFTNTNDDNIITFTNTASQGNLLSNKTTAVAEDLNGTIWIGTDVGLCLMDIFDTPYNFNNQAYEIVIDNNGVAEAVLSNQYITDIKIDGANRKWIGTRNSGVFLLSADGREEILNFNSDNSPLLTNEISSIAIDQENGEVYFASPLGTISYQSDASSGGENYSEAKIFPNPFNRNKHQYITINNLKENSFIRITDINGNLIKEATSNGGMFQWDCKNIKQQTVNTGIYIFLITDATGDTHTTLKLLVK